MGVCTPEEGKDSIGNSEESWGYQTTGDFGHNGNWTSAGISVGIGHKLGVTIDREAGTLEFDVNGEEQEGGK